LFAPITRYQYTTDLFLGESLIGESIQPLENVTTLHAMLKDSILAWPDSSLQDIGVLDLEKEVLTLTIDNGRGIRLRSEGPDEDLERIKAMHRFVADRTLAHLKQREAFFRGRAEGRLQGAKRTLQVADQARELFSAGAAQAGADVSRLAQAIQELRAEISEEGNRGDASGAASASEGLPHAGDSTFALGKRGQLAMYQNLDLADLPKVRLDSEKAEAEAGKTAAEMEQRIRDLTLEISMIDPPRVTRFAERSLTPAGPRKLVRLTIGFIGAGAIYLGVLAFLTWIRRSLRRA
jgi:hypothetical protein